MTERNLQVKISENFYILLALPQNLRRLGLGQATLIPAPLSRGVTRPVQCKCRLLRQALRTSHWRSVAQVGEVADPDRSVRKASDDIQLPTHRLNRAA